MPFKFVLDAIIAGFETDVMKGQITTVHCNDKEMHFCGKDIRKLADDLGLEVQYEPHNHEFFNRRVFVMYEGWKLFDLEHFEEAKDDN